MKIDDSWWKKKAKIKATNDKIIIGRINDITGEEDNDETGKDSLTFYKGKDYIFFRDDEIASIEIIEE